MGPLANIFDRALHKCLWRGPRGSVTGPACECESLDKILFSLLGRNNLVYYEILILQDERHLKEILWKPKRSKDKMVHEQGLYGVKKRYYLPPKKDDTEKDFLRWKTVLLAELQAHMSKKISKEISHNKRTHATIHNRTSVSRTVSQ